MNNSTSYVPDFGGNVYFGYTPKPMVSLLSFLVVLLVLVLAHEAGHFWVAKWSGMRVEEFGFGFPPRLFSREKKGTIYSFNAIPLGGFVRIAGENGEERGEGTFASASFQNAWRYYSLEWP